MPDDIPERPDTTVIPSSDEVPAAEEPDLEEAGSTVNDPPAAPEAEPERPGDLAEETPIADPATAREPATDEPAEDLVDDVGAIDDEPALKEPSEDEAEEPTTEEVPVTEEATAGETAPEEAAPEEEAAPNNKRWYVVKVQSAREESIKDAIERKVRIEGLEEFFGQIVIPVERYQELRRGKRVTKSIKLYPGYLFVEVEFNDRILYLFRETSGVGDFVGGGPLGKAPTPMEPAEVQRILDMQGKPVKPAEGAEPSEKTAREVIRVRPRFSVGDRLRVIDGNFSGMEGEVIDITDDKVKLQVLVLGMPVTLDLDFWQVETA